MSQLPEFKCLYGHSQLHGYICVGVNAYTRKNLDFGEAWSFRAKLPPTQKTVGLSFTLALDFGASSSHRAQ